MDKKHKKRIEVLQQKIAKLQQLLAAAKKQPDDPAEAPGLEKELPAGSPPVKRSPSNGGLNRHKNAPVSY